MIKNIKNRKGFTLIELLVVIAIIAILAVVVVLTLNPAELLRQARDSNRISDFATLKSALGLYSEDVATTTPMYKSADNIYVSYGSASTTTSTYIGATTSTYGFTATINTYLGVTASTSRAVDSTGWIPINFTLISSGAPIGSLPVDPTNSGYNIYVYAATSTSYKLATKMESAKYGYSGTGSDVVSTDGGNNTSTYEQGSNLQL
jgi:type IV pilus assembly protein PilA